MFCEQVQGERNGWDQPVPLSGVSADHPFSTSTTWCRRSRSAGRIVSTTAISQFHKLIIMVLLVPRQRRLEEGPGKRRKDSPVWVNQSPTSARSSPESQAITSDSIIVAIFRLIPLPYSYQACSQRSQKIRLSWQPSAGHIPDIIDHGVSSMGRLHGSVDLRRRCSHVPALPHAHYRCLHHTPPSPGSYDWSPKPPITPTPRVRYGMPVWVKLKYAALASATRQQGQSSCPWRCHRALPKKKQSYILSSSAFLRSVPGVQAPGRRSTWRPSGSPAQPRPRVPRTWPS